MRDKIRMIELQTVKSRISSSRTAEQKQLFVAAVIY